MSARLRLSLFAVGAAGLGALLVWGLSCLPPAGSFSGAYGELLARSAQGERRVTDVVAAINFDYRGFDTLGEEFILFTSVLGVVMLLRKQRGEARDRRGARDDRSRGRERAPASDAVWALSLLLVGITDCFGLYLISHGQVSPGGGFQGGAVLATAALVVFLASDARTFRAVAPTRRVEQGEAVGAAGFLAVGFLGLFAGRPFLTNVLPLGSPGQINSSGTILALNLTVGLEVAGGFVLVLTAFVSETLLRRSRARR